jgi:hypothetical protein
MPPELKELMKLYARRGIADWNAAPNASKQLASFALANGIAQKEWEANRTIEANLRGGADERGMFIPMPRINHSDILHCFFLPINHEGKTAFDLLLIVGSEQCLGFRFEPADRPDRTHGYGHVQMNRSMFRKTMEVKGIPQWVPDSYPAFPIRSSEPLRMFLSMATSIHGYEKGMIPLLQNVFENRPTQAAGYLEVLKETIM